jgi:hypothetical protein
MELHIQLKKAVERRAMRLVGENASARVVSIREDLRALRQAKSEARRKRLLRIGWQSQRIRNGYRQGREASQDSS